MEFRSIARGLECVNSLLKNFPVELVILKTLCPGKILASFTGEIAAVQNALETAKNGDLTYIDDFMLGNPVPQLIAAVRGVTPAADHGALGVMETFTASQGFVAADTAVKASGVSLVKIHIARGLAGKAHIYLTGSLGQVEAAIAAVEERFHPQVLGEQTIVASPDPRTWEAVW